MENLKHYEWLVGRTFEVKASGHEVFVSEVVDGGAKILVKYYYTMDRNNEVISIALSSFMDLFKVERW